MKKALISGITGQDGSYLAEFLLGKGYEVYGIIRRSSSFNTARIDPIYEDPHVPHRRLHLVYGDLNDASSLNRIIRTIQPDEIYNLGAQSHVRVSFDIPEYTGEITGLGTIRLLEAIRELVQSQAYREQYGFNSIVLFPVNLYGPRDNFDLATSHVIPALIRKCVAAKEAGHAALTLWGDGSPTREFLYVEDAAEGILRAAEQYDGNLPVNLGTGEEVTIRNLATMIAAEAGFTGQIDWDTTKPNGQPRRCLDVSRAKELFGFQAKHALRDGLKKTMQWFLANRHNLREVTF